VSYKSNNGACAIIENNKIVYIALLKNRIVLVISHISRSGGEFRVGFNDFVDGFQKVFFSSDLSAGSDREHPGLGAYGSVQKNINKLHKVLNAFSNYRISAPVELGQSLASKSNRISLSTLIERACILNI
jgi:hypothetical protein